MRVREHRDALARRAPLLGWLFVVCILVVAAAYGYVQLHEGRYYRELAENNRLRREPIRALRGETYYCEGLRTFRNHVKRAVEAALAPA